jgi:uncharacterized lipoprotein YajG
MPAGLAWLLPSFGIVAFLAGSVLWIAASRSKTTIETLEKNNSALNDRVAVLEAADARKDAEIAALKTANDVLTRTVNSSDKIAELLALIVKNHTELMRVMEANRP